MRNIEKLFAHIRLAIRGLAISLAPRAPVREDDAKSHSLRVLVTSFRKLARGGERRKLALVATSEAAMWEVQQTDVTRADQMKARPNPLPLVGRLAELVLVICLGARDILPVSGGRVGIAHIR